MQTDESLMIALQEGDRTAYQELYSRYAHRVLRFLARRLCSLQVAEEALQETFLRVYRFRHRYTPPRPFSPWLFTIAANVGKKVRADGADLQSGGPTSGGVIGPGTLSRTAKSMTLLLDCLEHHPASGADSAIVWMHGLGASYSDFLSVIPHLGLPRTRLVFPQAPSQPVTINAGYVMPSWYDIRTMHASPERESAEDIRASREKLHALVEREIARGIDPGRIVLAGFSQGGAMSLFVAHRFPRTLAGVVVLSAYPLMPEAWGEGHAANAETPVFFGHGRHDDVVDVARGREGAALVGARGVWHDYAMGHELCMQEVRDLAGWLGERLR